MVIQSARSKGGWLGSVRPALPAFLGMQLRRRRGPAPRRYKGGEAEEEGGEEEMQPLAAAPVLPAEGAEGEGEGGKEVPDQGASLDEQLEASRLSVSDEPTLIQTPAAVWLPYGESPAAEEQRAHVGPLGALLAALLWLSRLPARLANWALFTAQKLMTSRSLGVKLASYFAIGLPLVLGVAVLYSWASGKSFMDGLVQAYGNLYKVPGTTVLGDVNLAATALNNLTFFLGTFTFALILGVITDEVSNRYQRVREGNYAVTAQDHTLVLNWNPQIIPLLRQMRVAREERGAFQGPVVILAERDKQSMDRELAAALGRRGAGGRDVDITTRRGPPTSTLYLDRAAAAQARTVLVLAPEGGAGGQDCAAEKQVASLLALKTLRESLRANSAAGAADLPPQTIILQSPPAPSPASAAAAASATSLDNGSSAGSVQGGEGGGPAAAATLLRGGGHPVVEAARSLMAASAKPVEFADLDLECTLTNVMAQSAVQPGVASVYCSLVQQTSGGAEVYVRRYSELSGLTYGEARRRFGDAAVIGYISLGVSPDVRGFGADKLAEAAGEDLSLHGERWPHVHLNPRDDAVLLDNTALVLVAGHGGVRPLGWEPKEFELARQLEGELVRVEAQGPRFDPPQPRRRHVFVLEWGADGESPPSAQVTRLVAHLKAWLPPDSTVTVVGPSAPEVDCSIDSESGSYTNQPHHMHYFEEGITDRAVMQSVDAESEAAAERQARARQEAGRRRAVHLQYIGAAAGGGDLRRAVTDGGVAEADAVVVLSSSSAEDGGIQADAHTLAALVLLEDVVARSARSGAHPPLHVLGAVQRPETVQVANHLLAKLGRAQLTAELLQPDELAAGVLVQMGAEPLLRHVLAGFMTSRRGPTLHLHTPSRYALASKHPQSFAAVAERVRSRGETALGYISGSGRLVLAPSAGEERLYGPEDRLVVLA